MTFSAGSAGCLQHTPDKPKQEGKQERERKEERKKRQLGEASQEGTPCLPWST